jgi:L-iditol 2-dehydrogenase
MKTRTVSITQPGKTEVIERDINPQDDEILVKTYAASICGTDKNYFQGHIPRGTKMIDTSRSRHEAHVGYPILMGHEGAGIVEAVGKAASNYKIGDRVSSFLWGNTMGDYFICPADDEGYGAFHVPENISMDVATVGEPLACAMYAGLQSGVELGDTVAIVGAGFAGQIIAQTVKRMGAYKVVVIDIIDGKLDIAKKSGADIVLNPGKNDILAEIQKETKGMGVDVAIEAGGNEKTVQLCTDILKHGGILGLYSWILDPVHLFIDCWHNEGFDIRTLALMHRIKHDRIWFINQVFKILAQGMVAVDPLLTDSFPLAEAQKAFETAANKGNACKVLLKP